ncbi:LLM class flavin-dependent oxidoreductase [Myxococcota bacterium]|nr:LLM class flavin-dependent oxidoreductase [Myxococcota bacterium]
MSDVRFAVFLPQIRMSFSEIEEKVLAAEEFGYEGVWFMDHLWAPGMPQAENLEAMTLAAAIAARTERIRLGHLVLCNEFRHPAVLAKMAATLDHISGGRFDLGMGWGSVEAEMETFGIGLRPPAERADRLRESLEILDLLFAGEPVDYEGSHYQLRGALARPKPVQERIPLHLGGAGPRLTLPLVARHADWWNCPSYGIERLAELRPQVGDVRVSAQHPIGWVDSEERRDEVSAATHRRFDSWGGVMVGNADELAESMLREVEVGVEMFVLQFHDFGEIRSLETFAREVIPRVRGGVR